ncbi:lytic transglycosylase domain-containing protein [Pectinatus frisingensis]|uniref:lytic transglycosylase domain-containing protein n=1 Tax=Pectinatus frisingensis TaxID=865 RepID=UPI003D8060F6
MDYSDMSNDDFDNALGPAGSTAPFEGMSDEEFNNSLPQNTAPSTPAPTQDDDNGIVSDVKKLVTNAFGELDDWAHKTVSDLNYGGTNRSVSDIMRTMQNGAFSQSEINNQLEEYPQPTPEQANEVNKDISAATGKIAITPFVPAPIRAVAGALYAPQMLNDMADEYNKETSGDGEGDGSNPLGAVAGTAYNTLIKPVIGAAYNDVVHPEDTAEAIVNDPSEIWNKIFLPVAVIHGAYDKAIDTVGSAHSYFKVGEDSYKSMNDTEFDNSLPKADDTETSSTSDADFDNSLPPADTGTQETDQGEAQTYSGGVIDTGHPQIDAIVAEKARQYGVDPALIHKVIEQESSYNPDAVGGDEDPADRGQGLMQLIPSTAEELGVTDPFDIEQNIDGGVRYLKQCLDDHPGDLHAGVAEYNGSGPAADRYADEVLSRSVGGNVSDNGVETTNGTPVVQPDTSMLDDIQNDETVREQANDQDVDIFGNKLNNDGNVDNDNADLTTDETKNTEPESNPIADLDYKSIEDIDTKGMSKDDVLEKAHEVADDGDYQMAMQLADKAGSDKWRQVYANMRDYGTSNDIKIGGEQETEQPAMPLQLQDSVQKAVDDADATIKQNLDIPQDMKQPAEYTQSQERPNEPMQPAEQAPIDTNDVRNVNGETFYKTDGAVTAPQGQAWFDNHVSRFSGNRKSILLPDRIDSSMPEVIAPIGTDTPKMVDNASTSAVPEMAKTPIESDIANAADSEDVNIRQNLGIQGSPKEEAPAASPPAVEPPTGTMPTRLGIDTDLLEKAHEAGDNGDYLNAAKLAIAAGDSDWGKAYLDMHDNDVAMKKAAAGRAVTNDVNNNVNAEFSRIGGKDISKINPDGSIEIPADNEVASTVRNIIENTVAARNEIKSIFTPAAISDLSKMTAADLRSCLGEMARKSAVMKQLLTPAWNYFQKLDSNARFKFIDAVEHGTKFNDKRVQSYADIMRQVLDNKKAEVQALGTGKLQSWIENYFPHIWQNPQKAAIFAGQWLTKRPFEGSKSFLKRRIIPTTMDGIRAGLKPISDNPVDLVMMKVREMDKYVMANKFFQMEKDRGLCKFVKDVQGERAPSGWTSPKDNIAAKYGKSSVEVKEAYDPVIMKALNDTLDKIGIYHSRLTKIPLGKESAGVWGLADRGSDEVMTKLGGPESVLAHELGHQLAYKYRLDDVLLNDKTPVKIGGKEIPAGQEIKRELQILAEKRLDPNEMHQSELNYVHGGTEPIAALVEAYVHAPDMLKEISPVTYSRFKAFLNQHKELHQLRDIKPSLQLGENTGEQPINGLVTLGHYYMPQECTRIMDNYLSAGLRQYALVRDWMSISNNLNQCQLGLSAFHAGFTTIDALVSKTALGVHDIFHGNFVSGFKNLVQASTVVIPPITNLYRGSKLLKDYESGKDTPLTQAMGIAGGRARMDDIYRTNMIAKMQDAFNNGHYINAGLRAPFAVMEWAAKPIMEQLVPRQKLGVFADMVNDILKNNKDISGDEYQYQVQKAWNSVDNRLGQMVYDNLFWNKAVKDLLMASTRSVGWNVGTIRELGGAGIDTAKFVNDALHLKNPDFTYRMSYAMALPVTVGMLGAITGYLYGQPPQTLKDYFYPKTGMLDASGRPQRIQLPSYIKDAYGYGTHPIETIENKAAPAISMIAAMLKNKDYYGTEIRNPYDTAGNQLLQLLSYAAKESMPFAFQASRYNGKMGGQMLDKILPFIGITPAPSDINKTPLEKEVADMVSNEFANNTKTVQQYQQGQLRQQLTRDVQGAGGQETDSLRNAYNSGQITKEQYRKILTNSQLSPLQREVKELSPQQIQYLMKDANSSELPILQSAYAKKVKGR